MPSLENDTKTIMAILFVGAMSGVNVFAYSIYGVTFPYSAEAHAVLFGVSTVGAILMVKVLFDVFLGDMIEEQLLQRAITNYWSRKQREEENKRRVRESMRQFDQQYNYHLCLFHHPLKLCNQLVNRYLNLKLDN